MSIRKVKLPSFNNDEETTPTIDNVGQYLTNIVRLKTDKVPEKTKIEIKPDDDVNLYVLDKKIKRMLGDCEPEALQLYTKATKGIIASYNLLVPYREYEVFGEKRRLEKPDKEAEKQRQVNAFIECAKRFAEIIISKKDEDDVRLRCENCDSTLEDRGQTMWCNNCKTMKHVFIEQEVTSSETMSARNMSDKLNHFKTIVLAYQGEEDYDIETNHLNIIKTYAGRYDIKLKGMSKDTLSHILEQTKLKDELDSHINLLHKTLTGIPAPNISHLEDRIYGRHQEVITVFYQIKPSERKHALKPWYLFYQYLVAEEFDVDSRDFPMLKMRETLAWHNSTYRKITETLTKKGSLYCWDNTVDVNW